MDIDYTIKQVKSTKWEIGWQGLFRKQVFSKPTPNITTRSAHLFSTTFERFDNFATHRDPLALLEGWTLVLQIFPCVLTIKHSYPTNRT